MGDRRSRRRLIVLAVGTGMLAAALGITVTGGGFLPGDRALTRLLAPAGGGGGVRHASSELLGLIGTAGVVAAAASFVTLLARRRPRTAVLLAVTLAGGYALDASLKELIRRPPISGPGYSYPSGSALLAAAALTALCILAPPHRRRTVLRVGLPLVAVYSLLLLLARWHYLSDVVGGWALGVGWAALVCAVLCFPASPRRLSAHPCPRNASRPEARRTCRSGS